MLSTNHLLNTFVFVFCLDHLFECSLFRSDFVYDLFEHMSVGDQGGGGGGGLARRVTTKKLGGKPSRKKPTVSSQFKVHAMKHLQ